MCSSYHDTSKGLGILSRYPIDDISKRLLPFEPSQDGNTRIALMAR